MKEENSKKTENMNSKKNILRFTVSMDKDLLDELLRITGQKKKSRAVNVACREFVRMKQKENLLTLKGKIALKKEV
jgi:metal-responsive CopG/Arc/MetJ family transcriptional regulator